MKRALWSRLLDEDPDLRRWYDNLARGSEGTAVERVRVLCRFLAFQNLTPKGLADLAKSDRKRVEDMLSDFVGSLLKMGRSPGYAGNYVKAVRSWLDHNDIRLMRRIRIGSATPSIEDERVPTKEELRTVLNYANERCKSSIALISMSGLRPEVLGNGAGTDGLRNKDFPEMVVGEKTVEFTKIPAMVIVRAVLSKKKTKYFTFLGDEGCEYLKAYLERRLAEGEQLTGESPIVAVKRGYEKMGKSPRNKGSMFITTKNVTREIREAMRPRFRWRPYVLRSYFDTQLMLAENHGKITHSCRQFFMGHKGDIEATYTTNKGRLPDDLIEDLRATYRRCQDYLQTRPGENARNLKDELQVQLLLVAGFKKEEIEKMNLSAMSDEDFRNSVRERLLGAIVNNGARQKVVGVDQIEGEIAGGWEFVSTLPNGRVVMKIP